MKLLISLLMIENHHNVIDLKELRIKINQTGTYIYKKSNKKTQQSSENLQTDEDDNIIDNDRESSQRYLFEAIENKDYPKWKLYIQVMTEEQARNHKDNPFDLTKVWYKGDYPLIE